MLSGFRFRWGCSLLALSCLVLAGCPTAPPAGCSTSADCVDANLCNGAETCGADGVCAAGTAADCPDGQACVPATGLCGGDGGGFERALGLDDPGAEFISDRPQSINPFAASADAQLPPAADLTRDVPAIGDQGMLGSCTAWATGYAAASYTANRQFAWGTDGLSQDEIASPGYLYDRLLETDMFECGSGTFINTALDLLIADGCSSFALVGYSDATCNNGEANDDATNFRIGSYNRVVETDLDALRGELARGSIVVIGVRLDDDFQSYVGNPEVYTGSGVPLLSGAQHAAHAMAVVGYDDARQAFRIMNSWSTQWGDNGFMWMHYDTFTRTVFEAYSLEATNDREPVDPVNPDPDPVPDPADVQMVLDDAFQFADVEQDENGVSQPVVYLVFYFHATAPVFINSFTITGPGDTVVGEAVYENQFVDGYVHLSQTGGRWPTGDYTLEFDVNITDGTSNTILVLEARVGDLDDGGGSSGLCTDTCIFAYDGECDDGGTGALFDLCDLGSDCSDCGARDSDDVGDDGFCSNSCRFANDGECDDGGPDALFAVCALGTDCGDCGTRDRSSGDEICDNFCDYAFDGECDDGGAGADFAVCDFGSDCGDCGSRSSDDIGDLLGCDDTCPFAFDGECDDGGPNADFDVCGLGTDCFDCGASIGACDDTCQFAFDGECDDGGFGADFNVCVFGTDCFDCGPRSDDDIDDGGGFDVFCEDFCEFNFDGVCDDGGFDAEFAVCDFGADCTDCGTRTLDDFKTVARNAKGGSKSALTRVAKIGKSMTPKVDPSAKRSTQPARFFRGVKIETPAAAKNLPAKGIHEGVRGPNRKPIRVIGSERR